MKPVLGQHAEFAQMLSRARGLGVHHGILLEGPPGFGKSHAARDLAAAILCSEDGAIERACGVCAACAKVASDNHPDLHVVTRPEDKKSIPVDAVRSLQSKLALGSVEGRAVVVVIDPADALTEQGQNALLKTLEEPREGTFLILTARRPEGLLDTVRSRVMRYRLRGVDPDVLRSALDDGAVAPDVRARAIEASHGSIGLAREFCAEEGAAIDRAIAGLLGGQMSAFQAASAILEGAEGRIDADRRARSALRRCSALCRSQLAKVRALELAPGRAAAYAAQPESWIRASEAVFAAEEDLAVEIGPAHALSEMFLRWVELLGRAVSTAR